MAPKTCIGGGVIGGPEATPHTYVAIDLDDREAIVILCAGCGDCRKVKPLDDTAAEA